MCIKSLFPNSSPLSPGERISPLLPPKRSNNSPFLLLSSSFAFPHISSLLLQYLLVDFHLTTWKLNVWLRGMVFNCLRFSRMSNLTGVLKMTSSLLPNLAASELLSIWITKTTPAHLCMSGGSQAVKWLLSVWRWFTWDNSEVPTSFKVPHSCLQKDPEVPVFKTESGQWQELCISIFSRNRWFLTEIHGLDLGIIYIKGRESQYYKLVMYLQARLENKFWSTLVSI